SNDFTSPEYTPKQRCQEVSARFEKFYLTGTLNYLTAGIINGQPVVCSSAVFGQCTADQVLFTLKEKTDADRITQQLSDIYIGRSGSPVSEKIPLLPVVDDRQWLPSPQEEPLVGVLRSVVRIIAQIPPGSNIGAGWVVKREGNKAWIITNRHVVTDAQRNSSKSDKRELEFFSQPPPGKFPPRYPARILQITDANNPLDLALLEVTGIPEDIQPLPMSAAKVPRTTPVIAIGHPSNGGDWTTASGEISNVISQENKLQITATLAEGNSGGPVIDKENKQVVGIIVQITDTYQKRQDAAKTNQTESFTPATGGFGFAYSMDAVKKQLLIWGIP
ncbi:MAG: COP23 domain-containing protein, partial [Sphaerospermopsis kisseleviana]